MKLLFVGTNPEATGAATHFVALAQAMVEAGHRVDALVYPDGPVAQGLTGSGVRLYPTHFRNAFDLRGYAAVLAAVRRQRPDWLVGNFGKEYWPLVVVGRALGIPVALFRHRTPPMKRFSGYLLPRLAQRFYAVSRHARQAYLDQGIPGHLVRVLHNPVNLAACRPDPERRRAILRSLAIPEDAIVLGYFGRMHGGKGIFTLMEAAGEAMAREPRLHCLWLGDGPEAVALRAQAATQALGHRHHFAGWHHDVHPFYSAISMLAFPSIATETFGRVSVEAQAAGVPVLGSDIGGVPETLHDGVTGRLLPPGDVPAWRDAILALCDPAVRLPMGAAAQEFVQRNFATGVVAEQFAHSLAEATRRRSAFTRGPDASRG